MYRLFFGLTVLFTLASFAWSIEDPNTVLLMQFDEDLGKLKPGDEVKDQTEYENHGVVNGNGIEWTKDGKFGGALTFDGNSYIELPHSDSLDIKDELTLEIWFKTTQPQKGKFLIMKGNAGATRNYFWGLYLTGQSGNVSFYMVNPKQDVGFISAEGDFDNDEWYYLAGTYDSKVLKLYLNGELKIEKEWENEIRTGEQPGCIGAWLASKNCFAGSLDEVRISDIVRTDDEIAKTFVNGYVFPVSPKGKISITWAELKSK